MRRTARVLSVAVLAGAVLAGAAPAGSADPTAETGPATAAPDGSVTVSVTCDPLGAPAPATLVATSDAFAEGTVRLSLIPGGDELTGPVYRGTARIAPADALDAPEQTASADAARTVDGTCPAPPGGQGAPWSATLHVTRAESGDTPACAPSQGVDCGSGAKGACAPSQGGDCDSGGEPACAPAQGAECDSGGKAACAPSQGVDCDSGGEPGCAPARDAECDSGGEPACAPSQGGDCDSGGEPACASARGAECDGGTACAGQEHGTSCAPDEPCPKGHDEGCAAAEPSCPRGHDDPSCGPPSVQHGVRAGAGGAFGVSVPALAAGGLLIAGALGAAGHRLCRRGPREDA
ncbi:hypothetical protein [Streptomyces sp. NPDC088812]|uniref:hypothetical protein n=1 Tax=Streptomyces sp. NPDC088812 TaxID=3365905 RepID=UPI00380BF7CC